MRRSFLVALASIAFATTVFGQTPASNVTAGTFGTGNFAFPGNLAVGTSTPNTSFPFFTGGSGGYLGAFQANTSANGATARVLLQTTSSDAAMELDVVNDSNYTYSSYAQVQTGKTGNRISLLYHALDHRFFTGGSERLRIDSTGGISIGGNLAVGSSSATSYPFYAAGPGTSYVGVFQANSAANANSGRLLIQTSAAQSAVELDAVNDSSYVNGGFAQLATGKTAPVSFLYSSLDHRFFTSGAERVRIDSSGNVGIGSMSPTDKLVVNGNVMANGFKFSNGASLTGSSSNMIISSDTAPLLTVNATTACAACNPAAAFSLNSVTKADVGVAGSATTNVPVTGIAAGDLYIRSQNQKIVLSTDGGTSAALTIDATGNANFKGTVTGGNIVAQYQDVAEWVPSGQRLAPGTVVIINPLQKNEVEPASHAYDTAVAGVVSENPGVLLGLSGASKSMIATTGRVRVRVDATVNPIKPGDLLVSSDKAGVAMLSEPIAFGGVKIHRPGTLIGKALEALPAGEGEILVLLSLQ